MDRIRATFPPGSEHFTGLGGLSGNLDLNGPAKNDVSRGLSKSMATGGNIYKNDVICGLSKSMGSASKIHKNKINQGLSTAMAAGSNVNKVEMSRGLSKSMVADNNVHRNYVSHGLSKSLGSPNTLQQANDDRVKQKVENFLRSSIVYTGKDNGSVGVGGNDGVKEEGFRMYHENPLYKESEEEVLQGDEECREPSTSGMARSGRFLKNSSKWASKSISVDRSSVTSRCDLYRSFRGEDQNYPQSFPLSPHLLDQHLWWSYLPYEAETSVCEQGSSSAASQTEITRRRWRCICFVTCLTVVCLLFLTILTAVVMLSSYSKDERIPEKDQVRLEMMVESDQLTDSMLINTSTDFRRLSHALCNSLKNVYDSPSSVFKDHMSDCSITTISGASPIMKVKVDMTFTELTRKIDSDSYRDTLVVLAPSGVEGSILLGNNFLITTSSIRVVDDDV